VKGEKWTQSHRYIGEWNDNDKSGYGIQIYPNGDKYEVTLLTVVGNLGKQYALWKWYLLDIIQWKVKVWWKGRLRREYTGEWMNDKREGRGAFFYKNGDRYDGLWVNDLAQGEGRMIYANGDIFEGQWHEGKRNGYGSLTKRNGDHYEGQWVNDKREGQGSFYYKDKAKMLVGEWVNDMPKSGVYTQVEDEELLAKIPKKKYFTDPYFQPDIPTLKLKSAALVLETAMENVKRERASYRAQHIPIEAMFTSNELDELERAFKEAAQGNVFVDLLSLKTLLEGMEIYPLDKDIIKLVKTCLKTDDEVTEINFETFVRVFALLLEENMNNMEIEQQADPEVIKAEDSVQFVKKLNP